MATGELGPGTERRGVPAGAIVAVRGLGISMNSGPTDTRSPRSFPGGTEFVGAGRGRSCQTSSKTGTYEPTVTGKSRNLST